MPDNIDSKPRKKPAKKKTVEVKITIGHDLDGKPIRKSFYGSTKREANSKAQEYLIAKQQKQLVERDIPLAQWADLWLKTYIKGKVKDNTYYNNYENPLRLHIKPRFGNCHMTDIKPVDVQAFLDDMSETHKAESVKKMRVCLQLLFDAAMENDLCLKNPVTRNVKIKPDSEKTVKHFYTQEQRDLVIKYALTHPDGLGIIIMLVTAISRSELLALKFDDFTPDYVMHVRRGVVDTKRADTGKYEVLVSDDLKNGFRRRDLPIPDWLYNLVQSQPRVIMVKGSVHRPGGPHEAAVGYLFHNTVGGINSPHNWSVRVYKRFMRDLAAHYADEGIDIPILTPHELRHTAATLWALNKIDLYTISKLGGWSDLKMLSKVYGHADVEAMRAALGYEKPTEKSG